jgi:transmembrane sensor
MGKVLGKGNAAPAADSNGRSYGSRRRVLALVALAIVLTLGWVASRSPFGINAPRDRVAENDTEQIARVRQLATGPGDTLNVRLADGSSLRLEPGTNIGVRLDARVRHLTLERGKARFVVAREPRPFIVHAGGGHVTARGTTFDVGFAANRRVRVRLIEGMVEVTLPADANRSRSAAAPRRLLPGETLSFSALGGSDANANAPPNTRADKRASAAILQNAHDFDSVRIVELIAAANRASPRPIRLEDPWIGKLQVSGRFRIDDPELLAERIAGLFDLKVDRSGSAEIVLTRR